MKIFHRAQDLFTLAKLILPYRAYKNSLIDAEIETLSESYSTKALQTLGISVVNHGDTLLEEETSFVLDFTNKYHIKGEYIKDSYHYINNPDGSMRWVFPQDLAFPTFLSFYNISSWKSKAYAYLLKMAFKFDLQKLVVSGSFDLYAKATPHFKKYVFPNQVDNFSIFMGTVGPNRKVIIELNKKNTTKHFIKVALNDETANLIKNEFYSLDEVEDYAFIHVKTPYSFLFNEDRALMQPSLSDSSAKRSVQWAEIHTKAKLEMEIKSINKTTKTSCYLLAIKKRVQDLRQKHVLDFTLSALADKIEIVCDRVGSEFEVLPTSFCHNDFTPWNMYVEEKLLKVYDWELAGSAPVLTDLFHFHIQKGVMLEQKSYAEISHEIIHTLEQPEWKAFVKTNKINVPFQFAMYMVNVASYYLSIYSKQQTLHWQAVELLKVWNSALDETLSWQNKGSFRQQFIESYFQSIKTTSYAFLKFIYGSLDNLPIGSDLDVLIAKKDLAFATDVITNSVLVKKVKLVRKSFMTTAHIFFKDETFLSIDLITAFKQTNNIMLEAKEVLNERQLVNGLFMPNPKHNFEYILLFYHLNGSDIPVRYRDYFSFLSDLSKKNIELYLSEKYYLGRIRLENFFLKSTSILNSLRDEVYTMNVNNGFYAIRNNFNYLIDTLKSFVNNRGFMLTVSGVDGAGKSTIISEIKQLLESKYRKKVVVIRHRPSVLPILSAWVHGKEKAEKLTTERLPRTGNNQSKWKSIFRFSYYLLDYLFGQFYVYTKYILRGKVVVYDRYYFDFIIDSKRSNIVINPLIPKAFYSMVQKPELNVFLYAPAAEILKRKQELNAAEIEELTTSYQKLFGELALKNTKSEYLAIKNIHLQETMNAIDSEITKVA
jgi:thymidylate kinase